MIRFARLFRDCRAAAAAEMAMVAPLLCLIMLGSAELGRYFYNEHVVVKAVRDGAIFAARRSIDEFTCTKPGSGVAFTIGTINVNVRNATTALIQTGVLANGSGLTPQSTSAIPVYTLRCYTTAPDGTTLAGIYTANDGVVPVLLIDATVPYNTILKGFGFGTTITLRASEQAAVTAA